MLATPSVLFKPPRGSLTTTSCIVLVVSYASFVFVMWGPLGPFNGMGYETGFALRSETSSILKGFVFSDPLRVHTNFFYHLSYLLSKLIGLPGAWLVYQIVYAFLWLGRGLLCFFIVRALAPEAPVFAFVVGALTIFHASDHTLNWVGQMNQFGFILWMLLSFLLLIYSFRAATDYAGCLLAIAAAFFSYMSLWSYEAQLPTILLVPFLLVLIYRPQLRRRGAILAIYLTPSLIFLGLNIHRYASGSNGGGYQISVLRSDLTAKALAADLIYNVKYALLFWRWSELLPQQFSRQTYIAVPLAAAVLFVTGAWSFVRTCDRSAIIPSARKLALLLACGFFLLVASFPGFLILNSSLWLWRTQLLAGPSAALVMASSIGLAILGLQQLLNNSRISCFVRRTMLVVTGAAVGYFGAWASLIEASFHYATWERMRAPMEQLITTVPRVKNGTIILLLDGPRKNSPFGDNMWFDNAVKLTYPHSDVSGFYFLNEGAVPPGNNLIERAEIDASRLLVVRLINGQGVTEPIIPAELMKLHLIGQYDPARRIEIGPPAPEAINRYINFKLPWISLPSELFH